MMVWISETTGGFSLSQASKPKPFAQNHKEPKRHKFASVTTHHVLEGWVKPKK